MRTASYNQAELNQKYPTLAKHFDKLLESRKAGNTLYNLYIQYCGRWKSKGKQRRLNLGSIIEALEDHGYTVDFDIKKP